MNKKGNGKMKKLLASTVLAGLMASGAAAQEMDDLTFQLKWVNQGQFAGYLVAKDKGFYEEEGLNVTINPGGPDIAPEQVAMGRAASKDQVDRARRVFQQ